MFDLIRKILGNKQGGISVTEAESQDRRQLAACVVLLEAVHADYECTDEELNHVVQTLQSGFGVTKETALTSKCKGCDVLAACHGGCPKHRFAPTDYGEPGLHYLCPGYKNFFHHISKYLRAMTQLLENNLPVSYVMDAVKGPLIIRQGE